jgi:uncharacterized protein YyaL (SSP411 family)
MNRLTDSTSLYLQQHGDNPVDWHPWDEPALRLARDSGKPILLSIGYSACHWCHVMAHESFEDPSTARVMNDLYVNIKVDREERPDLDKLYQLSHQLLTSRGGGWPLTVFLDPGDLTPFFAGTYFPPVPRHGMPAFTELLHRLREWFDGNRGAVNEQNQRLRDAIASLQKGQAHEGQPDLSVFPAAIEQLSQRYDVQHGGFGGAPKFPQAPLLGLVQAMSQMREPFSPAAQQMLHETLSKMALSGLRDHLDGGFFRYTVDGSWTIPHFEKMLYDNALLLPLYAETAARTDDSLMAETAAGICDWMLNEMRHSNGGFYASMDADAGGVEGGFHVWDRDELRELLDADEFPQAAARFGIDGPPNFENRHWHLVRTGKGQDRRVIASAKQKMLEARAGRTAPATDTKQLTSWNALCIDGLARAGSALQREDWIDAAAQALDFVRNTLWKDGDLYAVHAGDQTRFPAYLDDYAFLVKASLSLLMARWDPQHLAFATTLADTMIEKFFDREHGGFFFSSGDQEMPIARLRPLQDDATPGGNGIAAQALETLGHLSAEQRYLDAAGRTLLGSYPEQQQHPLAHATLLVALHGHLKPPRQVMISGPDQQETQAWKAAITHHDRVNCYVLGPGPGDRAGLPDLYETGTRTTAYVCEGLRCLPRARSLDDLQEQLNSMD